MIVKTEQIANKAIEYVNAVITILANWIDSELFSNASKETPITPPTNTLIE